MTESWRRFCDIDIEANFVCRRRRRRQCDQMARLLFQFLAIYSCEIV